MATPIRDDEYTPMIVAEPKAKTLLICPVCGAAISRTAHGRHPAWHAELDRRAEHA